MFTSFLRITGKSINEVKEKIKERVQAYFLVDSFYSYLETKKYLQSLYSEYNIPRTPKAKDVNSYIEVKSINKLIDGVQTNGFIRLASIFE